jgi:hypothetical protein
MPHGKWAAAGRMRQDQVHFGLAVSPSVDAAFAACPLCPAGHLPHRWGDKFGAKAAVPPLMDDTLLVVVWCARKRRSKHVRLPRGVRRSGASFRLISPPVGEMSGRTEGAGREFNGSVAAPIRSNPPQKSCGSLPTVLPLFTAKPATYSSMREGSKTWPSMKRSLSATPSRPSPSSTDTDSIPSAWR